MFHIIYIYYAYSHTLMHRTHIMTLQIFDEYRDVRIKIHKFYIRIPTLN